MPKPRRTSKTPADTRTTEQRLTEEAEWRTKDFVESIVKMMQALATATGVPAPAGYLATKVKAT